METVKESIRLTDLLKVELCGPVNDQISHIQVCIPNIVEFAPRTPAVRPGVLGCRPDIPICRPNLAVCRPDFLVCGPDFVGCRPDIPICRPDFPPFKPAQSCGPSLYFQEESGPSQVPTPDFEEVVKAVKALKEEIAALKKKLG
jgi:hypothetical protein